MKDCEHYKGLLVGLLDHELTPEEAGEVNQHLIRCAACRADHERLRETTDRLEALSYREPGDAVLAALWKNPYSRLARNGSLFMIIGGYVLVVVYALVEFFAHGRDALPIKIGIAAITSGFLVLLIQLIRERFKTYQMDAYKEIER